ncbi:MAG: methionine biosynthesis protein MetW [Candidatus Korobacteraceae bacterium]
MSHRAFSEEPAGRNLSQMEPIPPPPQQQAAAAIPPRGNFRVFGAELETCIRASAEFGELNPRPPGFLNDGIQFAKGLMRRSLTWYTRPLRLFHGAVIRAMAGLEQELEQRQERVVEAVQSLSEVDDALCAGVATNREGLRTQADEIDRLGEQLRTQADEIGRLLAELEHVRNDLRQSTSQGRLRDRDLRRFLYDIQADTSHSSVHSVASTVPPMFPSGIKGDPEFDYFRFEELYRGGEVLIAARQREYLQYFSGRDDVVDIGCGRGEFLELLRENGIGARGVELGTDQYLLCLEKNLHVVQEDLFKFLESLPDESLGGLFSAQVIEHLTAGDQLRFVSLAHRKTRPGSPVIFETINAQCVFAVVRNFFLDPTHVRPVHPETLKFAMESMKFRDVELRFSAPMSERQIPPLKLNGDSPQLEDFNRAIGYLNDLLYGDMDYAAIGWR